LGNNLLCGVDHIGNGTYTPEGITKLCEAQGKRRDLAQVRRRPRVFAFLSAPLDTAVLSPFLLLPSPAGSLYGNLLGPEGTAALAEVLKGNSTLQSLK